MEGRSVIFVSNALSGGGSERVLCLLANEFASRGYHVGVLSFRSKKGEYPLDKSVLKEYPPFDRGPLKKAFRVRWIRDRVSKNPEATVISFEHFVNLQTLMACAGLRNRVVVSERNDPARVGNGFFRGRVRGILYRKAHLLVCQTDDAAAYFSDDINKTVILNPVKSDLPLPVDGPRRKTIVTFCRLEPQKNLQMLVEAFAIFHRTHPGYKLEIYGDGTEKSRLLGLIHALSLESHVDIRPATHSIHSKVRDCTMYVSSSDYEGLSNSMIEAMALGLPTICTDCPCGGARMVIDHERNGLLTPVGDTQALAQAMCQVADDADLATQLGRNAEEIHQRLSTQVIVDQWENAAMRNGR